jgi:DHA3 family macrolide efflux protein-like MFS transporter
VDVDLKQPATDLRVSAWKPPFFTLWIGQAFSLLGSQLVQFALVWWLTDSTHSATVLATSTLFALLPQILISPFAGALIDRWNRKRVMMLADSGIALVSLGLAYMFVVGRVQPWHVYLVMLIRSTGGAFHFPSMQASTSLMVPDQHLARVGGLNQSLNGAMNIAAPPLGALLLKLLPIQGVLMVDVVTACMAVLPLFFIHVPQPQRKAAEAGSGIIVPTSMWQDLRAGLRYVASWKGMLIVLAAAPVVNFLMVPAFSLFPLLVTQIFNGDAVKLSLMYSVWGLGLVSGGLLLTTWGGFHRKIATGLFGGVGMGVGILIVAAAPPSLFGMAVFGMGVAGFMNSLCNGAVFSTVQSIVAPEMQGRVISLLMASAAAIAPLSLIVAGPISDALGIRVWYVVAGVTCVVIGVAGFFVRPVMELEARVKGK